MNRFIGVVCSSFVAVFFLLQGWAAEKLDNTSLKNSQAGVDLFFLASKECEGRGPTTKGLNLAADYISESFKKAGLKPMGKDGTYFQPFKISGARLDAPAKVEWKKGSGESKTLTEEMVQGLGLSAAGKAEGKLLFAGFGMTVDEGKKYDDYAGLDAKGKIVMVLRDAPKFAEESKVFDSNAKKKQAASLTEKISNAATHGALAVLFVNDRETARETSDALLPFDYTALARTTAKIPAFHVSRKIAEQWLGRELDKAQENIEKSMKPDSSELDVAISADLKLTRGKEMVPLKNVIGKLEGKGPLADQVVVIGAHYDHLGYGGQGSLSNQKKLSIHHGADDNASGTTGLLELVRRFASKKGYEGRSILFMAFSGEELGLLGSSFYTKNPVYPIDKTSVMINLDMIGRLRADEKTKKEKILLEGTGTAEIFEPLLQKWNPNESFTFVKKQSGFGPSDHASFCEAKVPVLFFWTGVHPEYHTPLDKAETIDLVGLMKIVGLVENIAGELIADPKTPKFVEVKGSSTPRPAGNMPRLGIRPGYEDDKDGVLVEGVNDGDPAAKAGIRKGDRITEIQGKKVANIETYMQLMAGEKKGTTIQVTIIRESKKMTLPVKLD